MTLAAWSCGLATNCVAQTYAAGEVVTLPGTAGGYDYSSGAFGDSGPAHGGVAGAGYSGMPANCPPQPGYGAACEPQPTCWWKRPLLISPKLLKPPRGAYFRTEYLLWEIEEPGSVLLGSEPADELSGEFERDFDDPYFRSSLFDNDFDPSAGFPQFDPETGLFGFAYVPRMTELQMRDNSGIRLTMGIPTYDYGTIELSAWMLEQASDHYQFLPREIIPPFGVDIPGVPFSPATSFKIDGSNTNFVTRNHNQFLDVAYRSDLWGADVKYVVDSLSPHGEGFKLKPLFGVKYVDFDESMYQRGLFQSPTFGTLDSQINSHSNNAIFGGTVGLRAELEHRWFIAGVQPAVTFAGNASKVSVTTDRFASPTDGRNDDSASHFGFSPILDINAYVRVCLTENLRLNVGYDAFWMSQVYRAATIIDYNVATDGGTTARSDFKARKRTENVAVEGLSVGLEYVF